MELERSIAIIFFILGLSLFFRGESWKHMVARFNDPALYPFLGMLSLSVGSFLIVFFSDNFTESYRSIILLVLGYLSLLKALVFLFLPKQMKAALDWALKQHEALYRLEAILYILLALVLFF